MANFKIPGWFVHYHYQHASGQFNPGAYQEREVPKPTGQPNLGGFQERTVQSYGSATLRPGNYQEPQNIVVPTGAFNPGAYTDDGRQPDRDDPWNAFYFSLEIDGVAIAYFMECSGIKTSAEVFEIEEGAYISNVHKRSGRSKWENIILKRAIHTGHLFAEWRDYYMNYPSSGGWDKRLTSTATIVMHKRGAPPGTADNELRRFSMINPWPVSWEGPSLSSGGSALSEETLEIAHEGIDWGRPSQPQPQPQPQPEPEPEMETVLCVFDSPNYTPAGAQAMNNNVAAINKDPDAKTYYVEGHTCDMGTYAYNLTLSRSRATHAAEDLNARTSPDKKYEGDGFSYKWQAAPNTNETNRKLNRRVNIWPSPRPSGPRSGETLYNGPKPLG